MTARSYWLITVEDGQELVFHDVVSCGHLTEKAVARLLQRLVCRYGLSAEEIVSATVARRSKRRTERFLLRREQGHGRGEARYTLSMGDWPIVSASILTEDELRSRGLWKEA
ncbi:hypothetical protein ABIE45_002829 [Methylobacterium sp. OAE515]|uniref:hypothetical protein n=1 Tax=Methylobacterium sp. OAE515 TaxID=2817895 RepID=UPI00178AF50E